LTISACDGGVPSNCGSLKLTLNIADINDHNPVFQHSNYKFTVLENQPAGTLIGQISATDSDQGLNGHVTYSIVNSNSNSMEKNSLLKYFNLDSETGVLTLKTPLDYEDKQLFSLNVEAKDSGAGSLPAYTIIDITVLDVNDNSPEISVSFLNSLKRNVTDDNTQNIYMNENYESSKFIAHVSISDMDVNAKLEWKVLMNEKLIADSKSQTKQNECVAINKLNKNSFTVNTGKMKLDREAMPTVRIQIVSWDVVGLNEVSNKAVYKFVLHLLDVNDNRPEFEVELFELNVVENNRIGDFIHQFKALDSDEGINGKVTYKIKDDPIDSFVSLDETTGVLRAAKVFDREVRSNYEFIIVAKDSSLTDPQLFTEVKCRLRVLDINDNKPVITYTSEKAFTVFNNNTDTESLVLKVDENIPVKTRLVQFKCQDADQSQDNGKVTMKLINRVVKASRFITLDDRFIDLPFRLDSEGYMYVFKRLDREVTDTFDLTLICEDSGVDGKVLNSTLHVRVNVNDINDNCPRSVDIGKAKSKFLNRDKIFNEILFKYDYVDLDSGDNGRLKFELLSHVDVFKLKPKEVKQSMYSLEILFNFNQSRIDLSDEFIERLKIGHYLIKVKISDNGFPSCIKIDSFRVFIGSDDLHNETVLINHLKQVFKQPEDAVTHYINDKEDFDVNDDQDLATRHFSVDMIQSRQNLTTTFDTKSLLKMFTKNDYVVLLILIGLLFVVSSFLSIVGCVYFLKSSSNEKRLKQIKNGETLKVKNYCEIQVNSDSSVNTSNSEEDDNNSQTEINRLLAHEAGLDRFSGSLKSGEQSQSADSVMSSLTYTRELTISNTSHSSGSDEHLGNTRPKSHIYSEVVPKQHSTFLSGQKYHTQTMNSSSFKPSNYSPDKDYHKSTDSNVPLLGSFPTGQFTLTKTPQSHQKNHSIYMSKKDMLDTMLPYPALKNSYITSSSPHHNIRNNNEALSSSDRSEIMILPTSSSSISSPTSSSSASSETKMYQNSEELPVTRGVYKYNDLKQIHTSSEDDSKYHSSSTQESLNSTSVSVSNNRTNRSYLRSSAV